METLFSSVARALMRAVSRLIATRSSLWLALLISAIPAQADCISPEEHHLSTLINTYRESHRLPRIPISASLTLVARTHVRDLAANHPARDPCNLHSWSRKGAWTPCCYTSNHRTAQCMWEKPREIAGYPSDGYEIASEVWPPGLAEDHMEGWKSSEAHHAVILNRGTWSDMRWQAMGVGIFEGYAVVWFATQPDPKRRPPEPCRAGLPARSQPPGWPDPPPEERVQEAPRGPGGPPYGHRTRYVTIPLPQWTSSSHSSARCPTSPSQASISTTSPRYSRIAPASKP